MVKNITDMHLIDIQTTLIERKWRNDLQKISTIMFLKKIHILFKNIYPRPFRLETMTQWYQKCITSVYWRKKSPTIHPSLSTGKTCISFRQQVNSYWTFSGHVMFTHKTNLTGCVHPWKYFKNWKITCKTSLN